MCLCANRAIIELLFDEVSKIYNKDARPAFNQTNAHKEKQKNMSNGFYKTQREYRSERSMKALKLS